MSLAEREVLVYRIAGRIFRTLPNQSEARYARLVRAGMTVALFADQVFDPSREVSFRSFLKQRIHFAMFQELRSTQSEYQNPVAA
jgi:DNA-directed RNA polymerase specialized sigma subunit